jgi:hypothetical protein
VKLPNNLNITTKPVKAPLSPELKNTLKIEETLQTTVMSSQERSNNKNATKLHKNTDKSHRKWKQLSADIKKERIRKKQVTTEVISPGRQIRQLKNNSLLEHEPAYPITKQYKKMFRNFCLNPLQQARQKDRLIADKLKAYPALYEPLFNLRKSKNFKHFLISEAYLQSMVLPK